MLYARDLYGKKKDIIEDSDFSPVNYGRLTLGAIVLGRKLTNFTHKGENVGVLLPNAVGTVVTFFALQAYGRIAAMLNFSSSAPILKSACNTATIQTILTSKRFIHLAKLEELVEALSEHANIIYLEDIKRDISLKDKLVGAFSSPSKLHKNEQIGIDDPAVVLFTSGSEGEPKAVVLSHKNIMSNIAQMTSRFDFNVQDIVFNCLPMFHSFGLTGGTLGGIMNGVKTFEYPSPLHYHKIPELINDTKSTILFSTDTFLNGYARTAKPKDFEHIRYVFAGAESVKESTRDIYKDKFGVELFECYGATEASPAICVNSHALGKMGTVGQLLPSIEYKLEAVKGIQTGEQLYLKGPNIMLGYYRANDPGVLIPPSHGWYKTGDLVKVDEEGFFQIVGRVKRFARIGGDTISLRLVEEMAQSLYPQSEHAVISIPDKHKSEQLILVTTEQNANRNDFLSCVDRKGLHKFYAPRTIFNIEKIPILGSGKTDYLAVKKYILTKSPSP